MTTTTLKSFPITEKCFVCYDIFKETTDELVIQLICGHPFHYTCIVNSYKMKTGKKRECPYCRCDGGWLPEIPGYPKYKNLHKSYYKKNTVHKYYKNIKFGSYICKGYKKTKYTYKKIDNSWKKTYEKCYAKSKKNGYCGRHQQQITKPLMPPPTPTLPSGDPVLMI